MNFRNQYKLNQKKSVPTNQALLRTRILVQSTGVFNSGKRAQIKIGSRQSNARLRLFTCLVKVRDIICARVGILCQRILIDFHLNI